MSVVFLPILLVPSVGAQSPPAQSHAEPVLMSVFPWAARQGSAVDAEVRGHDLDGVNAVWFDMDGLEGRVLGVEKLHEPGTNKGPATKDPPVYVARIELRIGSAAAPGFHSLRLVSNRGLSSKLRFEVTRERVEVEQADPHQGVDHAQYMASPVIVNGRLSSPGEADYYSFEARKGEALFFEVETAEKYDPVLAVKRFAPLLALYRSGGSWFDPTRPTRLLFEEEKSTDLMPILAHGTYRFPQDGRYFLEVSGLFGEGGPDCSYQLRVAPAGSGSLAQVRDVEPQTEWAERTFDRQVEAKWTKTLESRSVESKIQALAGVKAAGAGQGGGSSSSQDPASARLPETTRSPSVFVEREPNDGISQAQSIVVPGIVEGTIGRQGDVDSFKFKVEAGQKLAFEIETPEAAPPYFNPRLGVADSQNNELFSNVHRRVSLFNNNADRHTYLKAVEPRAVYTFDRGGDYVLQIRDITSRYAGGSYRYRILVRPAQPHVGAISVQDVDHVNLVQGEAKTLVITAAYEEGFSGDVSYSFQGLPEGVQALPGAQLGDDRPPMEVDENPGVIAPKERKTTVVLMAGAHAPLSSQPQPVRLMCQPVVGGQVGPILPVRMIPLMVVAGPPEISTATTKSTGAKIP